MFGDLGRIPWETVLEYKEHRRVGWYLLKVQEQSTLICRNLNNQDRKATWMSKELSSKKKVKVEWVTLEEHKRYCLYM